MITCSCLFRKFVQEQLAYIHLAIEYSFLKLSLYDNVVNSINACLSGEQYANTFFREL